MDVHSLKFIHACDSPPTKETFESDKAFFLSRKKGDSSYWIEYSKSDKIHNRWIDCKQTTYNLDPKAKIFVMTKDNIKQFFEEYGEPPCEKSFFKKSIDDITKELEQLLVHINTFKYKFDPKDKDLILKTAEKFNEKVKFTILKKKSKDFKQWCYVNKRIIYLYQRIQYYTKSIYESNHNLILYKGKRELSSDKLREFDGIYIPYELFKFAKNFCGSDLYIRQYLKSLGTDSLIVWNWCFA